MPVPKIQSENFIEICLQLFELSLLHMQIWSHNIFGWGNGNEWYAVAHNNNWDGLALWRSFQFLDNTGCITTSAKEG